MKCSPSNQYLCISSRFTAMSGLLHTAINGSNSNLPDSTGRAGFATSFSAQSVTAPSFHHSGGLHGLHNMHGSFNVPNMPASLASRNAAMSGVPSGGVQQPDGSISSRRFATSNIPIALSQISHGSSHGHSGITNKGGVSVVGNPAYSSSMNGVGSSIPGLSSNTLTGNRSSIHGLGVSPILQNVGPRISSSMGTMAGGSNLGRTISSGGLSVPGLGSRVNLTPNSGSGSYNLQGANRLMSGMLQQAPQMIGMLGNSYSTSGGALSQNQLQAANSQISSIGMLSDLNSNESTPFDINDFPQLIGRPSSAGGPQSQLSSLRKHAVGVNSIVQQNQEFSIQNEDFPALPGYKGGQSDFSMDLHQKDQLHDNVSMMQSQHFPMSRSGGFNIGGTYTSGRQQQQQHITSVGSVDASFQPGSNQDLLHLGGSDLFPSSHGTYHSQNTGAPSIGLRPLNSPSISSTLGPYEQLMQQYQHQQSESPFRMQQMSAATQFRDQNLRSMQGAQTTTDRFGLLGLLSVIRMNDIELTALALGIDLTTLGLNLNSADKLHKTFTSPWSNQPAEGEPQYTLPSCYYSKPPPPLHQNYFSKFQLQTLFYIFYSMPKDEAQLYAAHELHARGWFYHREHKLWFTRVANVEPLVKTNTYERGSYIFFDKDNWDIVRKDNFILHYEAVEKKPSLPAQRP